MTAGLTLIIYYKILVLTKNSTIKDFLNISSLKFWNGCTEMFNILNFHGPAK